MLFGYARISTNDGRQELDRQLDAFEEMGVDSKYVFTDEVTGTAKKIPELERMLEMLRPGDVVVVSEMFRLGRSTRALLETIDRIRETGAGVKSIAEPWLDLSDDNPSANLLITIFAGLAQFERDMISLRVKDGLKSARKRGHVGGRPNVQNEHYDAVVALYKQGWSVPDIVEHEGISRATVYRILKDMREEEEGSEAQSRDTEN